DIGGSGAGTSDRRPCSPSDAGGMARTLPTRGERPIGHESQTKDGFAPYPDPPLNACPTRQLAHLPRREGRTHGHWTIVASYGMIPPRSRGEEFRFCRGNGRAGEVRNDDSASSDPIHLAKDLDGLDV